MYSRHNLHHTNHIDIYIQRILAWQPVVSFLKLLFHFASGNDWLDRCLPLFFKLSFRSWRFTESAVFLVQHNSSWHFLLHPFFVLVIILCELCFFFRQIYGWQNLQHLMGNVGAKILSSNITFVVKFSQVDESWKHE